MDDAPLTCTPETEIDEVRRMMLGRHARYMPVMSQGMLMGVITFYDVAKAVVDAQDFENRMLKAYIRDWPVESERRAAAQQSRACAMRACARSARLPLREDAALAQALSRRPPCPATPSAHLFRVTNFGESHGPAIGCVIDGCPPGMALAEADIQPDLDRRRPGTSRHVTQRNEPDAVEILSGVYEGQTTGTPICLLIRNTDQRSKDYGNIARHLPPRPRRLHLLAQVRPARPARRRPLVGAADGADGGAGAVARKWLREHYGTAFRGCMTAARRDPDSLRGLGACAAQPVLRRQRRRSPQLEAYMDALRKAGDSVRRAHPRRGDATCRSAWASRCSTSSTPTSPTR